MSAVRRYEKKDHILCISGNKVWKEPKDSPGKVQKLANFTKAAVKHVRTGRKTVSLEVIQRRFSICKDCPSLLFAERDPVPKLLRDCGVVGTCMHRTCGCHLHNTAKFPNKLAWASTRCPKNHWGENK